MVEGPVSSGLCSFICTCSEPSSVASLASSSITFAKESATFSSYSREIANESSQYKQVISASAVLLEVKGREDDDDDDGGHS